MSKSINRLAVMLVLAVSPAVLCLAKDQPRQVRAKVSDLLPKYEATAVVTGTVELPGTDELTDLGEQWSQQFLGIQPDCKIVYRPQVTTSVVQSLVAGTTDVGLTAREFTPEETKAFQAKFGYLPMHIPVCLDANLIFVHKDNPLTSITMEQLDAIYSTTRLGGAKAPLIRWSDLGVKGELGKQEIRAYSRKEGTATRTAFQSQALLKGTFCPILLERDESSQIADALLTDTAGLGYASLSAWYAGNKVLPVVPYRGSDARFPTQENITTSRYPMPRLFYIYVNRAPGKPLDPTLNEVLHYLLAREGQNAVADVGLMPGPVEFLTIALKRLNR